GTEVLAAGELEIDPEHAEVGRVAAELRAGRGDVEVEAAGPPVVPRGRRRCRGRHGRGGDGGRARHERKVRSERASAAQNSCCVMPASAWMRSYAQTSCSWTTRRRI